MNNPCPTHATWAFKTMEERLTALEGGSPGAGGQHQHVISDVTDLQAALDSKGTSSFSGNYPDLTNKPVLFSGAYGDLSGVPSTFAPAAHTQAIATITGLQAALDGKQVAGSYAASNHNHDAAYAGINHNHDAAYEPKNANIQAHVASVHAPSNAQKNSDITKAEIEAKLTGEISTHTHAGGGSDPWTIVALANDFTTSSATAVDVTGLSFTTAANGRYMFEAVLGIRSATATVNPRVGLAWPTGMTDGIAQIDESQSATARLMANGNIAAAILVAVGGIPNTTQTWPVTVWGWVKAGATPSGSVRIQLATETAATVVRVTAHSYLRFRSY